MSRLRRLKEKTRKNTIKTTMASLALVLAIGSTQVIGTYALFTDNVDVPSDLSISTGDIDVEVSDGLGFTDVQPGQKIEIPVTITNKGTLKQNISLKLDISDKITKYLTKPEFVFDGITINYDGVMHNKEELFVLEPGGSITGSINITVSAEMDKEVQNSLAGKPQNLNLTIESTQVNKDNTLVKNGFRDVALHKNTISLAQREIITIATGEKAYFTNGGGNSFKKLYVPVNVKGTNKQIELSAKVESTDNGTKYYEAEHYKDDKYGDYILIKSKNKDDELPFKGVVNITITVKVISGTNVESYDLKCNVTLNNAGTGGCPGNHPDHDGHGNGGKCHGEIVYDGHKTNVNILEEEVVESPKEAVVVPNESEVVESPKEERLVPSKPDIIETLKEEIEIQE